ncbi:hypothetical protein EXU57_15655 [Segetibacter sp. 3557_3]|uniref:DNA alkylation repair protein n=1 Tax=Segetibacter sp. 3557_3 TaxID=2547429 RepID=UPI00105910ED|nr:DNA alkylation repair protein [Segetibacter sp. 3557_3]TDH24246.1 hypothetical protein EXU57_15655 [Segetibacter sp. 3557_3]
MPALLKDIYDDRFFSTLSRSLESALPGFRKDLFLARVHNDGWEQRALKDRMKHIANCLNPFLNGNFRQQVPVLANIIKACRANGAKEQALEYMFLPEYIALFGIEDFASSMKAIELVTAFTSCEFAIRPFLNRYFDATMEQMLKWSTHQNPYVRRFSSEGSRPRLPWGLAIAGLKRDPTPLLPILENLKNDPSDYVRRSVANNLNDIAKDHPELVVELAARWKGTSK